eukprot:COSAG05_NODE_2156_length_3459_cov_6.286310_5_plen_41_part_01
MLALRFSSWLREGTHVVTATDGLVRRHLAVRLDAVLEAVQL